jgi:hypothetical protein
MQSSFTSYNVIDQLKKIFYYGYPQTHTGEVICARQKIYPFILQAESTGTSYQEQLCIKNSHCGLKRGWLKHSRLKKTGRVCFFDFLMFIPKG